MTVAQIPTDFIDLSGLELDPSQPHSTPLLESSSPPPSSPQPVRCRCGIQSDGHREAITQDTVECELCKNYTHVACITGRLSNILPEKFYCHMCADEDSEAKFQTVLRELPNIKKQSLGTAHRWLL